MNLHHMCIVLGVAACAAPSSTFQFNLAGDVVEHVVSSGEVTGTVDNAGNLALDDEVWSLLMELPGIATSSKEESVISLTIVSKETAETFTTSVAGTCSVTITPHASTNGSVVDGMFFCSGVASTDASKHVDVNGGEFHTLIDDSSNNPNSCPVPPCNP